MGFEKYLKTDKKLNKHIIERLKGTIDRVYDETVYLEDSIGDIEELSDELRSSIKQFTRNFSFSASAMQTEMSRLYRNYIKSATNPLTKIEKVFNAIAEPVVVLGKNPVASATHAYLVMLGYLWGMIDNFNAATAGFLFEHYCAGIMGIRLAEVPKAGKAEDIIYYGMSGNTYFSLKLIKKGGPIKTSLKNIQEFTKEGNELLFIIGEKISGGMIVTMFDGTSMVEDLVKKNMFLNMSLSMMKKKYFIDCKEFIIDFNKSINALIKVKTTPAFELMKEASDFLTASKDYFITRKPEKIIGVEQKYKELGKTVEEL